MSEELPQNKNNSVFADLLMIYLVAQWLVLLINFLRDFGWAGDSYDQVGLDYRKTDDIPSQQFAQLIHAFINLTVAGIGIIGIAAAKNYFLPGYGKTNLRNLSARVFFASLAALAAIYPWNLAQEAGQKVCESSGKGDIRNALCSAWAPGLAEGPTQMIINAIGNFVVDPEVRKQWKNPIKAAGLQFILLFYALLIGSSGGAMWQVAFVLGASVLEFGKYPTMLSLAFTVAIFNALSGAVGILVERKYGGKYSQITSHLRQCSSTLFSCKRGGNQEENASLLADDQQYSTDAFERML